ncbi:MAG: efflux RND transporter permease subunit, partial [Spirochaetaceae bacterium]
MLIKSVVQRPTTYFVIFALLILFGLYTCSGVAVDLFPEINPPVLVISTDYEGVGPQEVERAITRPLESILSNVSNIKSITSTTQQGNSQIILEFTWGSDMSEGSNEVRDRLDMARSFLPDDAGTPMIFKFDPSLIPILEMRMVGNRSPEELRRLALDIVQPRLEQLDGVAQAYVTGGRDQVIRVDIPRSRLDAYGLTFSQISQALRIQNMDLSAGRLIEGDTDYVIRTAGEFRTLEEIERTVVTQRDGALIRLGDLGTIYEGYRRDANRVYINGEPSLYVSVQKQSDANSVQAADNVLAQLDTINSELPSDVKLEVMSDTTQLIRDSLSSVSNQAIMGAVLAIIILFIFLRSYTSTLVVAVSIPTSIVITITLMYFAGLTLNLMTLAGLALGVGLLVDNSIVILENIYHYREKGAKLRPSATLGTQEMINAIVAATLTTISVFLPLALFRAQLELAGELFSGLAFTVVISLVASLLVAIFLVPILSSHYFPLVSRAQKPLKGRLARIDSAMEAFFVGMDNKYKSALRLVLKHKVFTSVIIIVFFVASLALIPSAGFELFPQQEEDTVTLDVNLPIGTKLDVTEEVLFQFQEIIKQEVQGYKDIILQVGGSSMLGGGSESHSGSVTITLPEYEDRIETAEEIQMALRPHFTAFPGVEIAFGSSGFGRGGMGGGRAIDIRIRTDDTDSARRAADAIIAILKEQVPEALDPEVNLSDGLPQVDIVIDRERAYALGLNTATIGQEVKANLDGITASRFRQDGNEYDIVLILDESDRTQIPDLDRIFVSNAANIRIPLSSFASYERTTGPVKIRRDSQARQIRVQADLAPGAQIGEVQPKIEALIAEQVILDDGVIIQYSGEFADVMRYGKVFISIILVAILLVFGVMAAQFESFIDPFIIFFTIPLTLIGVITIHVFMGVSLSLF